MSKEIHSAAEPGAPSRSNGQQVEVTSGDSSAPDWRDAVSAVLTALANDACAIGQLAGQAQTCRREDAGFLLVGIEALAERLGALADETLDHLLQGMVVGSRREWSAGHLSGALADLHRHALHAEVKADANAVGSAA